MLTFTSAEAQNQFDEVLDIAQRETVAITRDGRPAAFLISPQEMSERLDSRERRCKATTQSEQWSQAASEKVSPTAAALTEEEIDRLVHDARCSEALSSVPAPR